MHAVLPLPHLRWELGPHAPPCRGVTRLMRLGEARKLCPELVLAHVETIGAGGEVHEGGTSGEYKVGGGEGSGWGDAHKLCCCGVEREGRGGRVRSAWCTGSSLQLSPAPAHHHVCSRAHPHLPLPSPPLCRTSG